MADDNGQAPNQESVYEAQVVIEQFVANSAFREMVQKTEFRNAIQYVAGLVASCADMKVPSQAVRVSVVSDNGAVDFRYTLRKPGPSIIQASPSAIANLDKGMR